MKEVIFNNQNLSDEDIQIFENKVKVIIKNSKDELLVCKRNGVIHFIGGKVENNETCQEAAIREIAEETGIAISVSDISLQPFFRMKQYQQNYYNSGKNCLLSITYLLCDTDEKFDYDKRNLDEYESKKYTSFNDFFMRKIKNIIIQIATLNPALPRTADNSMYFTGK